MGIRRNQSVCYGKVCEAEVCGTDVCEDFIPFMCGNRMRATLISPTCKGVTFVGTEDVSIRQGIGINLLDGVYAYDEDGTELPITVSPETINKCEVGNHEVVYTAIGAYLSRDKRNVTITQIDPPTISGMDTAHISVDTDFDPANGVSAVDDNSNTVPFEYSGEYYRDASGAIASFETLKQTSAVSVLTTIEPIQSLNGYDKPWSGGNGKNLFYINEQTLGGITISLNNDGSYKMNGSATNAVFLRSNPYLLKAGQYRLSASSSSSSGYLARIRNSDTLALLTTMNADGGNGVNVSISTDTNVYWEITVLADTTLSNVVVYPQLEVGSVKTAFEPYSNICPISGHTECVTSVSGVNVWDEEWENGYFSLAGNPSASNTAIRSKNFCSCIGGQTYYYFFGGSVGTTYILWYDQNQTIIGQRVGVANATVTAPSDAVYFRICTNASYGTTYNNDISINYPSTDHDYHAYEGHQYTTSLGRTVYGGTLDVVSGVLTVDRAIKTFDGTENWVKTSNGNAYYLTLNVTGFPYAKGHADYNICDQYAFKGFAPSGYAAFLNSGEYLLYDYPSVNVTREIAFKNESITSLADWKAYLANNPLQLCYELSTPQTYQLTAQEVELLLGTNNLWTDCGSVNVTWEDNIPTSGAYQYPIKGTYQITYTAEDECGNETEVTRTIVVGD